MKTIFIPIFPGVVALSILRTEVFGRLSKEKNIRIILFVPSEHKLEYYKKEFKESKTLVYEVFNNYKSSVLDRILAKFKVYLLKTETMDTKRKMKLEQSGSYFNYYKSHLFNWIVARPSFRRMARFIDFHFIKDDNFSAVFDKYEPDLVFLSHLFGNEEISMLREAKKKGVKSIGFISSWDKLTSRCILRILPDYLVVPNELTKKEAIKYHDVNKDLIFISGPPQFDMYKNVLFKKREDFCKNLGIDPSKRLILFCPIGKSFSDIDWSLLKMLDGFIKSGELKNTHIIVRFPPNDTVEIRGEVSRENFTFMAPGTRFSSKRGVDWDMNKSDIQSLADSIYHSDLVICLPSTISIDACILDKPVINIDFSPTPTDSFYDAVSHFYEFTHYKNILKYSGIDLVGDRNELIQSILSYLNEPKKNTLGRRKIREEQAWKLDGQAGRRIASFILDKLKAQ